MKTIIILIQHISRILYLLVFAKSHHFGLGLPQNMHLIWIVHMILGPPRGLLVYSLFILLLAMDCPAKVQPHTAD